MEGEARVSKRFLPIFFPRPLPGLITSVARRKKARRNITGVVVLIGRFNRRNYAKSNLFRNTSTNVWPNGNIVHGKLYSFRQRGTCFYTVRKSNSHEARGRAAINSFRRERPINLTIVRPKLMGHDKRVLSLKYDRLTNVEHRAAPVKSTTVEKRVSN